jgi:hypothetical protein
MFARKLRYSQELLVIEVIADEVSLNVKDELVG